MKINLNLSLKKLLLVFMGAVPLATVATCVPLENGGGSFYFRSSGDFVEDTLEEIFDD